MSKTLMGVPLYEKNGKFINKVNNLIKEHGITQWHRKTFGICKQYSI